MDYTLLLFLLLRFLYRMEVTLMRRGGYMELGDFVHARLFVFVLSGWLLLVFCFIFLFGLVSYMLLLLACGGDMLMILFLSLSLSCFLLFSCEVADSPGWWMEGQGGRDY